MGLIYFQMKPSSEIVLANINALKEQGADYIIFIRDLEDLPCITSAKEEIITIENSFKLITVKAFESLFLADSQTLSILLGEKYEYPFPEKANNPYEELRQIFVEKRGENKGIGNNKKKIANLFVKHGFSLQHAAQHPNCPSAAYFLNKLKHINQAPIPPEGASYTDSPPLGAGGLSL
jgi:hypothetical protein